jgi:adenylate kinase
LGTVVDQSKKAPALLDEEAFQQDVEAYRATLLSAHTVVLSIAESQEQVTEAMRALELLGADRSADRPRQLVLISTCMSWANGPEPDPEEGVLTDDDYFSRKPHPHFAEHLRCEKLALRLHTPGVLDCCVITAGVFYGRAEGAFRQLFRQAWRYPNDPVTVLGTGNNVVPTAHIDDVSELVFRVAEKPPQQSHYIFCDKAQVTLAEVVTAISSAVGTGKVKHETAEAGALIPDITQLQLDTLLCNLRFGSDYPTLRRHFGFEFRTGGGRGPVEMADALKHEFVAALNLEPVRICVLGPPAVGKSTVAAALARYYGVEHLTEQSVVEYGLDRLAEDAAKLAGMDTEEDVAEAELEQWRARRQLYQEAADKLAAVNEEPVSNIRRCVETAWRGRRAVLPYGKRGAVGRPTVAGVAGVHRRTLDV